MKKTHKKSNAKALFDKGKPFFNKYQNKKTRQAYLKNFREFVRFCTSEKKIKSVDDMKGNTELIQQYTNMLKEKGLSASTVHTYIAPVCAFCGVGMQDIEKERRCTAEYKRGRSGNGKQKRSDNDIDNPLYSRTVEFQKRVGIRRAELARLKGRDFFYSEKLGIWCVFVEKGKGGKSQLQRILPEDVKFVEKYFEGVKPDEKIFSVSELDNKVNYHGLRAKHAQEAYRYYFEKLNGENGEEYREELKDLLWKRFHDKKGFHANKEAYRAFTEETTGIYKIRGKNKALALDHGLPTEYDKLAVMAVSVLHLSHWRNDVTIASYLLAF